jgi:hypothetical protein
VLRDSCLGVSDLPERHFHFVASVRERQAVVVAHRLEARHAPQKALVAGPPRLRSAHDAGAVRVAGQHPQHARSLGHEGGFARAAVQQGQFPETVAALQLFRDAAAALLPHLTSGQRYTYASLHIYYGRRPP